MVLVHFRDRLHRGHAGGCTLLVLAQGCHVWRLGLLCTGGPGADTGRPCLGHPDCIGLVGGSGDSGVPLT